MDEKKRTKGRFPQHCHRTINTTTILVCKTNNAPSLLPLAFSESLHLLLFFVFFFHLAV
jgi:hypothetical protein